MLVDQREGEAEREEAQVQGVDQRDKAQDVVVVAEAEYLALRLI